MPNSWRIVISCMVIWTIISDGDDWETFSDLVCFSLFFYFTVRDRPELESKFEERVRAAVEYASTIDDFDDLVDPRTLARHCLGPEPSHYILCAICREEKSEFL